MRRVLVFVSAFAAVAACNAIADNGKYTICSDDTCGAGDGGGASSGASGGASSGSSGASGGEGGMGDGSVACADPGASIPDCTDGELSQNVHTADADPRVIKVPSGDQEAPYQPNCMIIRAGQTVTWQGNLTSHPLIPRGNSSPNNPILPVEGSVTQVAYTFPCVGDFNFSCKNHFNAMLGTIRVIP